MLAAIPNAESLRGFAWRTVIPLLLIILSPLTAIILWYTHVALGGSLAQLWRELSQHGVVPTIYRIWRPVFFGSPTAWAILGTFAAMQLIFMRILPGKRFIGPITPNGNLPAYTTNGVPAFLLTVSLFCILSFGVHLFPATIVYDHFGPILGALNVFSLGFCLLLYVKGREFPSSSDHGSSGNPIFDYFWGTELFPRIFGWDVKMVTNCRLALMGWAIIIISFAAKQQERYGLSDAMVVAVALQLIYIAKFFWWESGYLSSLDIMHDRAGFYICWGCLVWLPSVYTSSTLYLVNHPHQLGVPLATFIFVLGATSVIVNYLADAQRQRVRATNGECMVWRRQPVLIVGRYALVDGTRNQSLLLASGWWGISRHFHYLPEVTAAFCWTVPVLFDQILPYFYVIFLIILLIHRAMRDDRRCAQKYGAAWEEYCRRVPYKIVPGIY